MFLILFFFKRIVTIPYGLMEDDGYFYAQIAYNIGVNGISSFDGINTTDGYHLLWCWILAGLSFLMKTFTLNKTIHIFMFVFCQLVLISYFVVKASKQNIYAGFSIFSFFIFGNLLMETVLLSCLLIYLVYGNKNWFYYLSFFLIPLTRIDAVVIIAPFLIFVLYKNTKEGLNIIAMSLLGILVHFLSVKLLSGEWFTVSSIIKSNNYSSSFENITRNIFLHKRSFFRVFTLSLSLFSALWVTYRKNNISKTNILIVGLILFYIMHLFSGVMRSWYFVPGTVVSTAVFYSYYVKNKINNLVYGALFLLALFHVAARVWVIFSYSDEATKVNKFVADIEKVVPEGEVLFQVDASGFTGYFSQRKVVNGDGLVNTHAFSNRMFAGKLDGYLEENDICFVIDNYSRKEKPVVDVGGIHITRDDVELVTGERSDCSYPMTCFSLYRLKAERCKKISLKNDGVSL